MKDDGELLCKSKNLHAINFSPSGSGRSFSQSHGMLASGGKNNSPAFDCTCNCQRARKTIGRCPIFSEYENLIQLAHGIGLRVTIASIFSGKSTPYFRLPAPFNSLTISVQTWTIVNWHTLYDGAKNLVRLKLSTSAHSHNWL